MARVVPRLPGRPEPNPLSQQRLDPADVVLSRFGMPFARVPDPDASPDVSAPVIGERSREPSFPSLEAPPEGRGQVVHGEGRGIAVEGEGAVLVVGPRAP